MSRPKPSTDSRESVALRNRQLRLGPMHSSPSTVLDRLRAEDTQFLRFLRRDPALMKEWGVSADLLDAEIACRRVLASKGLK